MTTKKEYNDALKVIAKYVAEKSIEEAKEAMAEDTPGDYYYGKKMTPAQGALADLSYNAENHTGCFEDLFDAVFKEVSRLNKSTKPKKATKKAPK